MDGFYSIFPSKPYDARRKNRVRRIKEICGLRGIYFKEDMCGISLNAGSCVMKPKTCFMQKINVLMLY